MGANRKHLAMTITPNKWELDVQGYLNVCNITSATPRKQIRDFSAGVNDLGLWNSMVCWPLRSSQNYGSGTTAYSLGGLGTFNGTLVNGPTLGADGVLFAYSTAAKITTTLAQASSDDINIFAAVECNPFITNPHCICGTRGGAGGSAAGFTSAQDWYGNGGGTIIWDATGGAPIDIYTTRITSGAYNVYTSRVQCSSATKTAGVKFNTGTEATKSAVVTYNAGSTFAIGNQNPTSADSLGGKMPFISYFKTPSLSSSVYTLYKSTLGTGLGLP